MFLFGPPTKKIRIKKNFVKVVQYEPKNLRCLPFMIICFVGKNENDAELLEMAYVVEFVSYIALANVRPLFFKHMGHYLTLFKIAWAQFFIWPEKHRIEPLHVLGKTQRGKNLPYILFCQKIFDVRVAEFFHDIARGVFAHKPARHFRFEKKSFCLS